jgi:methionine sulfoxide reductase catalytic subunit
VRFRQQGRSDPHRERVVYYSPFSYVASPSTGSASCSFGEGAEGGQFYDSLSVQNAMRPQTLLAYEMNFEPLNHLHGAPLRLRVENQLGFKMVKWIQTIEFVESVHSIYQGEGGYNEDHEYFGELANI